MKAKMLACGYYMIPYILNGDVNAGISKKDLEISLSAINKLQKDRQIERLGGNYSPKNLHLDKMFSYSILYDCKKKQPVMLSGIQQVGKFSARMFSRYFVFPGYRTSHSKSSLLNKVDNFEVFKEEILSVTEKFNFIFWSRDRTGVFFDRIKKNRPELFQNWQLFSEKVELIYKGNFQYIFYLNLSNLPTEKFINEDLTFSKV